MKEGTVTTQSRTRSFIIKRPRLTKILDDSEARILLLVAPAGYGKTTLAREWLEGKEGVAWYSGGPSMADVAALAAGVAEALSSADDELTERIRNVAATSQSSEVLARAIAASDAAGRCTILALDDCHYATDSYSANTFLSELIARTEFRIVATSRVRPVWVTPRMLVYGEAATLEMNDLAFTDAEAAEVMALSPHPQPAVADARGWPAVAGLVANRDGTGAPAGGLEPSDLYEFFAEELFNAISPELQQGLFLLALGADAEWSVAIELLGVKYDTLLKEAHERGFLAGGSEETKLHPLIRAFLLGKLNRRPNQDVEALVRKVVTALAERRCWDGCLTSLGEFQVAELIASTLDQALVDLLAAGRIATIKRWLALASAGGLTDPILLLAEAEVALREGDDRRAQALGERAGEQLGAGDTAARAYLVAGRAAHLRDSRDAAKHFCTLSEQLATSADIKLQAQWGQFTSAMERDRSGLVEIVSRMRALGDPHPEAALRIQQAEGLLHIYAEGDAYAALAEFEIASGLLPHVRDPVLRTGSLNLHAYSLLVLARYEELLDLAEQLVQEAESSGVDFAIDHAFIHKTSALIGLRSLRLAQRTIADLAQRSSKAPGYVLRNTNLQAARLRIALGDLDRAEILLRRHGDFSRDAWPERLAYRGSVLAALGRTQESEEVLRRAQVSAESFDSVAMTELGVAIASLQSGRSGSDSLARAALFRAIDRGRLDALVTACRMFPDLARVASADNALAQSLTELFMRSRDFDLGRRVGLQMPRELRKTEGLSAREREVYELLVQGRTNADIARILFISESTTKVHVRHIFEKLGVHTRAEAALAPPPDF